jgi:chemotaxis protein MotB
MKNILFPTAIAIIALSSCSTIYRCGETTPENFKANKRILAVVQERDSLCTDLALEKAENEELSASLFAEQQQKAELQGEYDLLKTECAMTRDQLSADLLAKSDQLNQKEKTLAEREKSLQEMQEIIARQDSITNRLNTVLRDALLGFQADELSVEVKNGKVYVSMSDKLLFKSGSASAEAKGKEAIDALADVLQKNPDIDIMIEGHTDNVPIKTAMYKDNWDLSAARATSIVRLLAEKGIDPTRLTAAGRGEFQPRASNDTSEGKALNRRTEIILSPKLDELMELLGGQ